jgi:hypothetical protein
LKHWQILLSTHPITPIIKMNQASNKLQQVAGALGLSNLYKMQASTGVVFDTIPGNVLRGTFFAGVSKRTVPFTNLTDNRFEQNEALLIEAIAIYLTPIDAATGPNAIAPTNPPVNIRANLKVANSVVLKDILLGSTIAQGNTFKIQAAAQYNSVYYIKPGIVIPPNLTFEVDFESDTVLGDAEAVRVGCVLYGTRVLTNLGNSI